MRFLPSCPFDYITSKLVLLDDVEQRALVGVYKVFAKGGHHLLELKSVSYDELDARRYNHNRYH